MIGALVDVVSAPLVRVLVVVVAVLVAVLACRHPLFDRWRPRLGGMLAIGAVAILAVLVVQAAIGVDRIGISNDEPVHISRTNSWLRTRWYLPEVWIDPNEQVVDRVATTRLHTYGAAFGLTAHAMGVLTGTEPLDHASDSADAYRVRRWTVLAVALGGAAAVGYATAVLWRRRALGVWAATATMAMPLWTGYGLFAVKDIPAGAGWTMVTAGVVAALAPGIDRPRAVVSSSLIAAGVWWSVGTRVGLWVPIFGTILIATVFALLATDARRRRLATTSIVAPTCVSAAALAAVHPRNLATPIAWLWNAAVRSADFDEASRLTLTAGRLVGTKPPWWYLPAWTTASVPPLLGVLAVVGGCYVVLTNARRGQPWRERLSSPDWLMTFWVMQAVTLSLFAIAVRATMYGGLRHHVYMMPALAALGAYALHRLTVQREGADKPNGLRLAIVGVVALLAVALPLVDQLRLHPYAFTYKNALGGSVNDRWETDMHWVSAREAIWHLPPGTGVLCYKGSTRDDEPPPVIQDCTHHPQVAPFLGEMGRRATITDIGTDVWVIARRSNASPPLPGCASVADVSRLGGSRVVMSYVLRCDPALVGVPPPA